MSPQQARRIVDNPKGYAPAVVGLARVVLREIALKNDPVHQAKIKRKHRRR